MMQDLTHVSGVPSITCPADGVPPAPPVITRVQRLPFGELTWENFERLCHRLVTLEGDVEYCARYGRQGDAQAGIDIYARQRDGRYHCLQAKRRQTFGAAEMVDAINLFLQGSWAARAARFTISVQCSLRSTKVQEVIEQQAARLLAQGINFVAADGESLTDRLRPHPELVDDFFGRPWVQALLGEDAVKQLQTRLDGAAFAKARAQLGRVYESHFHSLDPGGFGSIGEVEGRPELTLLERFLKPDILVREVTGPMEQSSGAANGNQQDYQGLVSSPEAVERSRRNTSAPASRIRRVPMTEWTGDAQRLVVLGEAGSGKSTLLRVIALDLLRDQTHFPELAARWGRHLPIYVPFARWSAQGARIGSAVGVKDIVRRSLDPLLTGSLADLIDQAIDDGRVLLLIDGLDEWSSEQAARTTLKLLITTVEAHNMPVVVSGRPRGLEKIGALPVAWRRGKVAPLSVAQQFSIASRWFSRHSSERPALDESSAASLRTGRFMAELARDANLAALASTPLLLVGLVTLALRGQILPRTRKDIYDQLVRVLLEVHPSNRATAAGDTESRFRHAVDPDQLRAAIGHLAFANRQQAGGAGIALAVARDALHAFLVSPSNFALEPGQATKVVAEILSVNSETQGLLVEKGPGEVGFVHASFQEYLAAEHVGSWSFEVITAFVRLHAGDARWRNVITNLLGCLKRRDEVERLVAVIEEPCADELSKFNRQALLGDIAFAVSPQAAITAKRLALATMQRVESQDWLPARREALASVLKGLGEPALKNEIEERLARWLPSRHSWRPSLIEALGSWSPSPELQDSLYRAMHDEDRDTQRAAAIAYAKVFASSEAAGRRLADGLACSRDVEASAAMLESLARGWHTAKYATPLFREAWEAHRGEVRLAGAIGVLAGGERPLEMRDLLLAAQYWWSPLSHSHQSLAAALLASYWPNDQDLMDGATSWVGGSRRRPWGLDSARSYLLACDVAHPAIRNWFLRELSGEFPFNFHSHENRAWDQVGRLATVDPEIRAAANAYWLDPKHRIIGMHKMVNYVRHVADPEVAAVLLEGLKIKQGSFDRMWAVAALTAGWGRQHPDVRSQLDAVLMDTDEKLEELVSVLPALYSDKAQARARLLRMGRLPSVRRHLLTAALADCGCDGSDEEAVETILSQPMDGLYSSHGLFQAFAAHPAIRAMAAMALRTENESLSVIAAGFADDSEFTGAILRAATPLPTELRTQIVEMAAEGAAGTALESVLGQSMLESDAELTVRMVKAHCARLPPSARAGARTLLLERAVALGPDFESIRAAALAGLIAIDALDGLVDLQDRGKPVQFFTGTGYKPIPSLDRQICERFAAFDAIFGAGLAERFETFGASSRLAQILTVAPGASPAARSAFMKLAEQGELPREIQTVRALAAERPRSALLMKYCWDLLERVQRDNRAAMENAEIAIVLRRHFPDDVELRQRLVALYERSPCAVTAVALAVYEPKADELAQPDAGRLDREFCDWTAAVHIAAGRASAQEFTVLLEAMVTRSFRTDFDAQEFTNLAVQERLQHDQELFELLSARLHVGVDPSISGSFARYLAAAGKIDADVHARVSDLLRAVGAEQRLPLAGYDAIAGVWRATRSTLLDALTAGLELT